MLAERMASIEGGWAGAVRAWLILVLAAFPSTCADRGFYCGNPRPDFIETARTGFAADRVGHVVVLAGILVATATLLIRVKLPLNPSSSFNGIGNLACALGSRGTHLVKQLANRQVHGAH